MAEGDVRRTWAEPERSAGARRRSEAQKRAAGAGRSELGYRAEVGMDKGITVQVERVLEEEVASSPVSGGQDLL